MGHRAVKPVTALALNVSVRGEAVNNYDDSRAIGDLDNSPGQYVTARDGVGKVREIKAEDLPIGVEVSHGLFDDSGILLLAEGSVITPRFVELLARRRIGSVFLPGPTPVQLNAHERKELVEHLDESISADLGHCVSARSKGASRQAILPVEHLRAEAGACVQKHAETSQILRGVFEEACFGSKSTGAVIQSAIGSFITMMELDDGVLPMVLSMQEPKHEYLFDHCVNISLLSMSMSAQLGWSQEQIAEIGYGAMISDVGMLRVPEEIRLAPRKLTRDERNEMELHPFYTIEALERISGVPRTAHFIAYQSHERGDRTGYPKKRSDMYVHPYAKVVAIADAYCAMTSPRPHRRALSSYEAAKTILKHASENKYDRSFVRAFLDAISLFPVGSHVEISSGLKGQVVRSNPGAHTRPFIDLLDADGQTTGQLIDLSNHSELKVVRALSSPQPRAKLEIAAA